MANYDFTTLNDKDFEELCRDLLNRSLNLNFNSFKYGRDEGIDLRHSTIIKDNSIIVQAKHYVRSGKSQLLAELKREAIKVKALDPTRYIIVTSVELSAKDQVLIKEIFKPYITNASDVIGPAILNVWLDEYKDIQTNHFKLWMSSVNIIQSIINQSIHGRSRFYFDQIKAKLSLYVTTQDLSEGLRVLTENKVLIISGEPGVGKTTLADVITFRIMSENFSLFKLESIQEGENVFSSNIEDKQLFYFDDFLGSIYLEYSLASGTDSALNYFIDRVRKTPNKYIILTTRTVILNQAFSISAKFKRGYLASEQIEIKLNKYTYLDKAKILYNHLYFRNINNDFKDVFYKNELYFWFIKHKNYNPRIIEFITDENRIRSFDKDNYGEFLLNAFINPEQIWSDSFTSQINDEQRFLLFSLFLFKDSNAMEDRLKQVYEKRLLYEISTNGHSRSNDSYNNSLKILLDGFIARHVNILGEDTYTTVSYLNPSLSDYIKFFLRLSIEERIRMIFSIIHLENLDVFLDAFKDETLSKEEMRLIMAILENDEINAYSSDVIPGNATLLYKIKLLVQMGTDNAIVDSFKKIFEKINWFDPFSDSYNALTVILGKVYTNPALLSYIQDNFQLMSSTIIENLDYDDFLWFRDLFDLFEIDYSIFISDPSNKTLLKYTSKVLIEEYLESQIDDLKSEISELSSVESLSDEIMGLIDKASAFLDVDLDIEINTSKIDWEQHIYENTTPDSNDFRETYRGNNAPIYNEDQVIRALFDK